MITTLATTAAANEVRANKRLMLSSPRPTSGGVVDEPGS
jgi:hypothetical protein